MSQKIWLYELTSGSLPVLQYQQSQVAEIYRRWDVVQHVNNELFFPQPTNVLENPRIIVISQSRHLSDIDLFLKETYTVNHVTDYKHEKVYRTRSYENVKDIIKLPWEIRHTYHHSNISQPCQCIIVTLTYYHQTHVVEGLEQFKLAHEVLHSSKELIIIVKTPKEDGSYIDDIMSHILGYVKKNLPGWLTFKEIQELKSKICLSSTSGLDTLIQECLMSSLLRYSTSFHDHCLQAFQMFDVLVEEEEENLMKRKECRQKYLDNYKKIINENRVDMESKVKDALEDESEDILQKEMVDVKIKFDENYKKSLWNRLLVILSQWLYKILQSFVQELTREFTQNISVGNHIYSICVEQLAISSENTAEYSDSFLQSLQNILKNIWKFVFGNKKETEKEIIQKACLKFKEKSDNISQNIVKSYIEHYFKNIEEQTKISESGQSVLLRRLKDDSYKIKLQINSVVREITKQNKQQVRTSVGHRLRSQVETTGVRNLLTRAKGVKSFGVYYDKLQISVTSKTSFMEEMEKGLKNELYKQGVYDINVVECGKEPTWKPFVSSGDKIPVDLNDLNRYGTVGSLVKTHDGKLAFISAAHVLQEGKDVFVQKVESEEPVRVGKCIWSQSVLFSGLVDLSLVKLDDGLQNDEENLGKHQHSDKRWFKYNMYEGEFIDLLGKPVFKIGATTGYTKGTIVFKDEFPITENNNVEVWLVDSEEDKYFFEAGDSGSVVYTFEPHKTPQIQFVSLVQGKGEGKDNKKLYTGPLKQSIKRYNSDTGLTIRVNW